MSNFIKIGSDFYNTNIITRIETRDVETYRGSGEYDYNLNLYYKDNAGDELIREYTYKTEEKRLLATNNISWQMGI